MESINGFSNISHGLLVMGTSEHQHDKDRIRTYIQSLLRRNHDAVVIGKRSSHQRTTQ
ncbi:hypothetical protein SDC9_206297 [bioreactor metagenome]|uniref:Uncharacterized protein n=1 Tax=bioreactor metagenome TaxID=1076179 RepID=A0A645J627_9ZZZZ